MPKTDEYTLEMRCEREEEQLWLEEIYSDLDSIDEAHDLGVAA